MGDAEEEGLVGDGADELEADGQAVGCETAVDGNGREAGEVGRFALESLRVGPPAFPRAPLSGAQLVLAVEGVSRKSSVSKSRCRSCQGASESVIAFRSAIKS